MILRLLIRSFFAFGDSFPNPNVSSTAAEEEGASSGDASRTSEMSSMSLMYSSPSLMLLSLSIFYPFLLLLLPIVFKLFLSAPEERGKAQPKAAAQSPRPTCVAAGAAAVAVLSQPERVMGKCGCRIKGSEPWWLNNDVLVSTDTCCRSRNERADSGSRRRDDDDDGNGALVPEAALLADDELGSVVAAAAAAGAAAADDDDVVVVVATRACRQC